MLRIVVLAGVLVIASACEDTGAAASADTAKLCSGPGLDAARPMGATSVSGPFGRAAAQTLTWASSGRSHVVTAPLAKLSVETTVAFCYYDGRFDGAPQPPNGTINYDRALFLVPASRSPILYEVGTAATIPILRPDQATP